LLDLLNTQQRAFNRATVARSFRCCWRSRAARRAGGRANAYAQAVHLEADAAMLGRMVDVRIEDLGRFSLKGSLPSIPFVAAQTAWSACLTFDASATQPGTPLHLQFDDNRLLPLLFGQHDQNLARIEQELGVSLVSRGNQLAISGPPAAVQTARQVLTGSISG